MGSQVASGHPFPVKLMYLSPIFMIIECGATMKYYLNTNYQWLLLDTVKQMKTHPESMVYFQLHFFAAEIMVLS